MKFFNKMVAFWIAAVILLVQNISIYAQPEAEAALDNKYMPLLSSLSIMQFNEDVDSLNDTMTALDFAVILAKLQFNFDDDQLAEFYNDIGSVTKDNKYFKIISDWGLLDEDDVFLSGSPVLYEQAVTAMVVCLGYDFRAKHMGGTFDDYIRVGSDINIAKIKNAKMGETMTKEMTAELIYRAVHTDIAKYTSVVGDNEVYSVMKDKTILTEKFNVYKGTGQIIGTKDTRLTNPNGRIKEDEVEIDEYIYKVGATKASDYLGYTLDYYYRQKTSGDDRVLIFFEVNKNIDSIVIPAENIVSYDNRIITYLNNLNDRNTRKAGVAPSVDIIFNGKAILDTPLNDLLPINGKIELISAAGKNGYSVARITSYITYVVDHVDAFNEIIYPKYGLQQLSLDSSNSDREIYISEYGNELDIKNLHEWDVLSIAADREKWNDEKTKREVDPDYLLMSINVSREQVMGTVSEFGESKYLTINETEYELSKDFPVSQVKITSGTIGIFYLDVQGKVAAFKIQSPDTQKYAYLVAGRSAGDFGESAELKLFLSDGSFQVYKVSKNVEIDGRTLSTKTAQKILGELKSTALLPNSGSVDKNIGGISQIIKYVLNADKEIKEIDTIAEYETDKNTKKVNLTYACSIKDALFKAPQRTLGIVSELGGNVVGISPDFVLFHVPTTLDDESFILRDNSYFSGDSRYFQNDFAYMYDSNDVRTVKAGVYIDSSASGFEPSGFFNNDTPFAVVERFSSSINDKYERIDRIHLFVEGQLKSLPFESNIKINRETFMPGDVIRYSLNSFGEINQIKKILSADGKKTSSSYTYKGSLQVIAPDVWEKTGLYATFNNGYTPIYGDVYARESSVILLKTLIPKSGTTIELIPNPENPLEMIPDPDNLPELIEVFTSPYSISSAKIYVVDPNKEKNKVSVGNMADIVSGNGEDGGSKVLLHVKYEELPKEIIVFLPKEN